MYIYIYISYIHARTHILSLSLYNPPDLRESAYRVAKTHRMTCLYRSFSAKEPYN